MRKPWIETAIAVVMAALMVVTLLTLAVSADTAIGVSADTAAAVPPSATATQEPRQGTLRLARDHVPEGTTTVEAQLDGFRDGDHAQVTAESAASGGPLTLYPGGVTIGPDGSAHVTLHIPGIAPDGTYTVRAVADESKTHAQAFLSIDAPVTTATAGPRGAATLVLPGSLTLAAGVATTPLTVAVSNFGPDTSITVSLVLLDEGAGATGTGVMTASAPLVVGTIGPTSGDGMATGRVDLPGGLVAGTYEATAAQASNGVGTASTSVTIYSAAESGNPVDLCGVFNVCVNMRDAARAALLGALAAVNDITDNGRKGVVQGVLDALFYQPDLTEKTFAPLQAPLRNVFALAYALIRLAIVVRVGNLVLDLFAERNFGRGVLLLLIGGGVVYWAVGNALTLEAGVWQWTRRLVDTLDKGTAAPVDAAMQKYLHMDPKTLADKATFGFGTVLILVMILLLAPLVIALILTKFLVVGTLVLLFLVGAMYIVFLFAPLTRPAGLWWLKGMAALTLVAPLYASLASVGVALVSVILAAGGDAFKAAVVTAGAGLVVGVLIMGAPELAPRMVGVFGRGGAGAADDVGHAAGRVRGGVQVRARGALARARGILPF